MISHQAEVSSSHSWKATPFLLPQYIQLKVTLLGGTPCAGWLASGDPPMWGLVPSTQEKGGTTNLLRWGPNLD